MKMYFDKFSEIGSTHKENEDFAVLGDEKHPFVIVSDGCSGSKNTSTGSRLLSLCAAKMLTEFKFTSFLNSSDIGRSTVSHAAGVSNLLSLNQDCIDATLMVAHISGDAISVYSWGDGCVFFKHKNYEPEILKIEYTPEMPYYLSYEVDNDKDSQYKKLVNNGEISKRESTGIESENVDPLLPTELAIWGKDLEYIILSTDGISSFIDDKNNPVDQKIIDKKVNSFKRINGEFIGRRMNRMMKENAKEGITHYDDFTVAGISFIEED